MGASFSMSVIAFDLKTGQALDVDAAIADARAKREAAQRKDAAEAQGGRAAQPAQRDSGGARAVPPRDRAGAPHGGLDHAQPASRSSRPTARSIDYDRRGTFTRRKDPYDQSWLCTDGFDDREIEWGSLTPLIDKAILAANLDDEDRDHAVINVERPSPSKCEPTKVEVQFTNYKTPWPWVDFDAKGRLVRVR